MSADAAQPISHSTNKLCFISAIVGVIWLSRLLVIPKKRPKHILVNQRNFYKFYKCEIKLI